MWPAFDHRLDPSRIERLEGERTELVGAKAGRGGEMQLAILVEQPDRRDVDGKGGNENIDHVLERTHESLTRSRGNRLLKRYPPPLSLLEKLPAEDLVGDVDAECQHHSSPAVGVDPVQAEAPPAWASAGRLVAQLGEVTRTAGHRHFRQHCCELRRSRPAVALVVVETDDLAESELRAREFEQGRARVEIS